MRGKVSDFMAGGRRVFVYAPPGAGQALPLVQMAAGDELIEQLPQIMGEVEPLLGQGCAPFLMCWTAPADWERDYTPWPAPALQGRPPFSGGGPVQFKCQKKKAEKQDYGGKQSAEHVQCG